jgi:hypothetical protein
MQHGHEAQKIQTDMQYEQVAWKSSMDMHAPYLKGLSHQIFKAFL